ncbi:hypothetical protein [Haloarcula salina]|uniref:Uncharacterized protein n=1 Tax=Haloarcula salina TaxID=1429914 RepID=A0AA41FXS8_9EURY|nr:hypothetical protein [Haloarcula salina]MBV0900540.1 hypothetical protein [Haloarcula salina]
MTPDESAPADADGGYVHRPEGDADASPDAGTDAEFGTSGWALVGMLVVAFLIVPGAILLLPAAQGIIRALGLTLRDAYLTLPLIPAFALGAFAVWSALRSHAE